MSTDSKTPINDDKVAAVMKVLRDNVDGCVLCQPNDEDEVVWLGEHTCLGELLAKGQRFEEKAVEQALKEFRCPSCDASLGRDDEVLIKSVDAREVKVFVEGSTDRALVEQLNAFNDFLAQYPYLGASDPLGTGKEIIDAIAASAPIEMGSVVLHRARLFDGDSRIFRSDEMGAPNPAKVKHIPEGRFNHTGQSLLYLSEYEETALAEVSLNKADACVIQKYELKGFGKILNLAYTFRAVGRRLSPLQASLVFNGFVSKILPAAIVHNGFVGKRPDGVSCWKPEYFVPRFLSDVARLHGYLGIIFKSAISAGNNVVVFDAYSPHCLPIGEPYIYQRKLKDRLPKAGLVNGSGSAGT